MAELLARISDGVDARRDRIVETLQELVRIPTQTPPGENYPEIVERLIPRFAALGFDAHRIDMPEELFKQRVRAYYPEAVGTRANLLARKPILDKPGMAWYAHLDTVPVGDPAKWSMPPLEAIVNEGRVWGRGAGDCKSSVTAILSAFEALHELGIEPEVSPVVAFTTDEEIGLYTGLMYLTDRGEFNGCQALHCADGSGAGIGIATTGVLTWSIYAKGVSMHSQWSPLAVNPIERSIPLLQGLLALKARVQTRVSSIPQDPEAIERGAIPVIMSILNINIARGGVKHSIVPPEFAIEGDRLYPPEEDQESVIAELRAVLEKERARDPKLQAEMVIRPCYTSYSIDANHPWVKRMQRVARAVTGREQPVFGTNGANDCAYVARTAGIPTAKLGCSHVGVTNSHGLDENVLVEDVLNQTKIVAATAAGVLG